MDSGLEGEQRRVRYFSPQVEVSFCGHATVAAGVLLGRLEGAGIYRLETALGEVPVTFRQGEAMGRPSQLKVEIPASGGIRVAGTAVVL